MCEAGREAVVVVGRLPGADGKEKGVDYIADEIALNGTDQIYTRYFIQFSRLSVEDCQKRQVVWLDANVHHKDNERVASMLRSWNFTVSQFTQPADAIAAIQSITRQEDVDLRVITSGGLGYDNREALWAAIHNPNVHYRHIYIRWIVFCLNVAQHSQWAADLQTRAKVIKANLFFSVINHISSVRPLVAE